MIEIVGSLVMCLCSGLLFFATISLGRDRRPR